MTRVVEKGWGREVIFVSNDMYCGKLLCFDEAGQRGSMHFHMKKHETWYVQSGSFRVYWIDKFTAEVSSRELKVGDTWSNEPGFSHQLEALEADSVVFEVSTPDYPDDSYRVMKGDSQR